MDGTVNTVNADPRINQLQAPRGQQSLDFRPRFRHHEIGRLSCATVGVAVGDCWPVSLRIWRRMAFTVALLICSWRAASAPDSARKVANPTTELAVVVGASSAFPPVLSPARLKLKDTDFIPGTGVDLQKPPFTEEIFLTDGGVYDNLGLETAWKEYDTILVSDGGGKMAADPEPHTDWVRHALRINEVIDNQVRSLRKRQVIGSFTTGDRKGTYCSADTSP